MPKEFAKLDARETIVSLFCDNLGRPNATMQQCYSMRPDKKPAEGIAQFTGTLHLNRPDLNYHQREKQKLHHFNFKLTNAKPIRVKLTEAEMKKQFISEIEKASRCPATTLQKQKLKIPIQPQDRPAPIVACRPTSSIRPDHPAPPVLAPTRALRHRVRLF